MDILSYLIPTIFISLVLGVLVFFYLKKREEGKILGSLDMTLFLVMVPEHGTKKEEGGQKDEKAIIGQMEQVYASFLSMKKPSFFKKITQGYPKVAFEMASQIGGTDISFYVAVPKYLETGLEKHIHGVYPKAVVEKIDNDYTIFEPSGFTAGSFLRLKDYPILPINTYKALDKDPLAEITTALSKIAAEEGAAVQVVIRPAPSRHWKTIGDKVLSKMREGKTVKSAYLEATRSLFMELLAEMSNVFLGKANKEKEEKDLDEKRMKGVRTDERMIQIVQSKVQKEIFETNIRLVASAQSQERADDILGHLETAFSQFSLSAMNSFSSRGMKGGNLKKLVFDFSFRNFNQSQSNILNIEELTSVYHFPTSFTETPYIKTVKSVAAAPPIETSGACFNLVGKVLFRGEEKNICFVTREDRRRHFYIIGQTGTGKSSLLREMIRQDVENGEGVAVIDPHGELVEHTLENIPKERAEDVVLFEPFDLERPVGLNMLEYDTPEQKDFAVQEMIAIFYKLFPPEIIGPMFEHYMRNAMLALMADRDNPGTLVEIPRMFTDTEFMQSRVAKVTDAVVRSFWLKEWQQTTGGTRSDMLGYVVSKVGRFIENEMMRNIIGQSHSGFDLAKIMDEKKIFLANLSKGLTGEVNSSLLGLILVSKMQMAAMRRARMAEEQRQDFYLYIDEFQNFTTNSIATILSEARKYKLNLVIAHQYIPQLTQEIRDAVLGNVGTIGTFRVGANDAEFLEKQFEPEFSKYDLVNLDNFTLAIKMMIKDKISSPFKIQLPFYKKGNLEIVEPLKKLSKLKYGKPRAVVESEIAERSKLGEL